MKRNNRTNLHRHSSFADSAYAYARASSASSLLDSPYYEDETNATGHDQSNVVQAEFLPLAGEFAQKQFLTPE